jgi:hypothetical protein
VANGGLRIYVKISVWFKNSAPQDKPIVTGCSNVERRIPSIGLTPALGIFFHEMGFALSALDVMVLIRINI